jgi:hypothetical protein
MARDRGGETIERGGHPRRGGARSVRLDKSESAMPDRHDEVHLETLLIPEVGEFSLSTAAGLVEDLRGDESLEDRAEELGAGSARALTPSRADDRTSTFSGRVHNPRRARATRLDQIDLEAGHL